MKQQHQQLQLQPTQAQLELVSEESQPPLEPSSSEHHLQPHNNNNNNNNNDDDNDTLAQLERHWKEAEKSLAVVSAERDSLIVELEKTRSALAIAEVRCAEEGQQHQEELAMEQDKLNHLQDTVHQTQATIMKNLADKIQRLSHELGATATATATATSSSSSSSSLSSSSSSSPDECHELTLIWNHFESVVTKIRLECERKDKDLASALLTVVDLQTQVKMVESNAVQLKEQSSAAKPNMQSLAKLEQLVASMDRQYVESQTKWEQVRQDLLARDQRIQELEQVIASAQPLSATTQQPSSSPTTTTTTTTATTPDVVSLKKEIERLRLAAEAAESRVHDVTARWVEKLKQVMHEKKQLEKRIELLGPASTTVAHEE